VAGACVEVCEDCEEAGDESSDNPFDADPEYEAVVEAGGSDASRAAYGAALGDYRGVTAYSNYKPCDPSPSCWFGVGNGRSTGPCGYQFQCVEYAVRFFVEAHGYDSMRGSGNARDYWHGPGTEAARRLERHPNGGTEPPRPGDLVVFDSARHGHVAIVREVGADHLRIIQQNWLHRAAETNLRLPMRVEGGHYTVVALGSNGSYPTLGWRRVPGGGGDAFACAWRAQNPDTEDAVVMHPGEQREVEMVYENTGSGPWVRVGAGEEHPDGVVLASVDRSGRIVDSFAVGDGWFDPQHVTSLGRGVERVAPGHDAIFTFRMRIPEDAEPREVRIYFMPVHQRLGPRPDDCWGEAHFRIDIRTEGCPGVCEPGAEVTDACDRCGTRTRRCGRDCRWGAWGDCRDSGACEAGANQERACEGGGTEERRCGDDCRWGPWGDCAGGGACEPGREEQRGCERCGTETRRCGDDRTWGGWGDCQDSGPCSPGQEQSEACEGSSTGACAPGTRARRCGEDCRWASWGDCRDRVEPRQERFDGRDDDCDGSTDELWRPIVRCSREGVFRYRDSRDLTCFDDWSADNHGRPYFSLHKAAGGERLDRTSRLYNDFHACRGQLLSFFESPAGDGAAGWQDAGATWYAPSREQRDAHPGVVGILRLEKDVAACGNPRYLFLPETAGVEVDAARQAGWRVSGEPAFYAWPGP